MIPHSASRPAPACPSLDDVARLVASPYGHSSIPLRDVALLELLYATGCRASEIAGLRMCDLRQATGMAIVLGKGRRERLVVYGTPAAAALAVYLRDCRPLLVSRIEQNPSGYVFLSVAGRRLNRKDIWRITKKYLAIARLPSCYTTHSLRHACASHLVAGGAALEIVQRLLGHALITTTAVYLHSDDATRRQVWSHTGPCR